MDSNKNNYEAIICGGGIIGASIARELKLNGKKDILVIDASKPGGGATAACMGHVVTMDDSDDQMNFTCLSRRLWEEIVAELPENCDDSHAGTLWVAEDEEEMLEVRKKAAYYEKFGIKGEICDAERLYELEPNIRRGFVGAFRVPDDRIVYPTNCTRYFLQGIEVLEDTKISALEDETVVLENGRKLTAPIIVNALGAWSPKLTPELPMEPRKGHLTITDRYPGFVNHQIVELGYIKSAHGNDPESVAFNIQPRPNGQMLLGSSREFVDFKPGINKPLLKRMLDRAVYYMPKLSELRGFRTWLGYRPCSKDGMPFIGAWPKTKGLYIATGHEGLGITTSLGTARMLVDEILGRESEISREAFRADRVLQEGYSYEHH